MRRTLPKESHPGLPPALLTVENGCAHLGGISRASLYKLLQSGAIKSVVVAGRRMLVRESCDGYVASLVGEDLDAA